MDQIDDLVVCLFALHLETLRQILFYHRICISFCLPFFLSQVEMELDNSLGIQVLSQNFEHMAYSYIHLHEIVYVSLKYTFF